VTCVSTLSPASSRTQPYLSSAAESTVIPNRNVRGGFLALRGRDFRHGIGVTTASRTTYDLRREYQSLLATIGIDDEADGGGSAVFAVEVDGRRIFTSPLLTGRSQPLDVGPLDVSRANELTLIVDYGEYGDIRDDADWGNAVLVRPAN
jgi:beta-galactosidase